MKILSFTSIRSDYDLTSKLLKLLHADPSVELRLLVSGAHLSSTFGRSVDLIRKDGLVCLANIETLIDSDTPQSRVKTASLLMQNAIDIVAHYNPDLIMYAGDREDVIIAAMIAGYLEIPSMHFYGGDHVQDGYIDNAVRHAVSKLSSIHMVATSQHKKRLLRLGEAEHRVHVIGNMSLDNFRTHTPMTKRQIRDSFSIREGFKTFALVIFHPLPQEKEPAALVFENILTALKRRGIPAFVSYPNSDPGNKAIIAVCNKFGNDGNFRFYKNLARDQFLSIYKQSSFIIGNSSSGICESASIPIPAINVGLRQTGRHADHNIIFCDTDRLAIERSITQATSPPFLRGISTIVNSYGDGHSARRAHKIIKNLDVRKLRVKTEDPIEVN
jgi:UDP-N-acetylglucosamine 2-epimerase (non-hydrolysing)/GDP/UDP-N,N'-diacetylbacillosamine 2-epimerase (hydrolysing)